MTFLKRQYNYDNGNRLLNELLQRLLRDCYGFSRPEYVREIQEDENKVYGCTSNVWVVLEDDNPIFDSSSAFVKDYLLLFVPVKHHRRYQKCDFRTVSIFKY